ncbi:MAG: hypothetical protein Q8P48_06185 [Deltaproteobacteria bacterium]|nr:hypothetical protein [Deltaproteobacteria bacterium]
MLNIRSRSGARKASPVDIVILVGAAVNLVVICAIIALWALRG